MVMSDYPDPVEAADDRIAPRQDERIYTPPPQDEPGPAVMVAAYRAPDEPQSEQEVEYPSQAKQVTQTGGLIIREVIETLLLTLLIFWVVNTITGRFRIEGSSMMPTMQEGEYILINKLAYWIDQPERGDIVVLHYPRDPSRDFIKRVIALEGDSVSVRDRQVYVNEVLLNEPYINAPPSYSGEWVVPEDNVFVFGDNRNNSQDSHSFGGVPLDMIVGRGWVVYWPFDQIEQVPHHPHPAVPEISPTSG